MANDLPNSRGNLTHMSGAYLLTSEWFALTVHLYEDEMLY